MTYRTARFDAIGLMTLPRCTSHNQETMKKRKNAFGLQSHKIETTSIKYPKTLENLTDNPYDLRQEKTNETNTTRLDSNHNPGRAWTMGALGNLSPSMVDRQRVLLGHDDGVRTMSEVICGDCLYPISQCGHGQDLRQKKGR